MSGFIYGAKHQPTDEGAIIWLVQADHGWTPVSTDWAVLLEAKVAEGPPYAEDILPPVHYYDTGKGWNQTQYTLNVAKMTQVSDNKNKTSRDLMRVIVAPPPQGLPAPPGLVRAAQDSTGGGNGNDEDGNGGGEGPGGTQGAEGGGGVKDNGDATGKGCTPAMQGDQATQGAEKEATKTTDTAT